MQNFIKITELFIKQNFPKTRRLKTHSARSNFSDIFKFPTDFNEKKTIILLLIIKVDINTVQMMYKSLYIVCKFMHSIGL